MYYVPNTQSGNAVVTASGKIAGYCTSSDANCMQYYTKATCQANASSAAVTLMDARDGQTYTVRYINGNCWMTRNLAIGCNGTGSIYGSGYKAKNLTPDDSNVVDSTYTTSTTGINAEGAGSGLHVAMQKCSSTYGAWYNYTAASAMTITGSPNTTDASQDICPAGWRMPSYSDATTIVGSANKFNPVIGGYYRNGSSVEYTDRAYWWTSTAVIGTNADRYRIGWYGSGDLKVQNEANYRGYGLYIRCIRST